MDKQIKAGTNADNGFRTAGARLALIALLACAVVSPAALAHGGRVHVGVGLYFGAPAFGYPDYYHYPHYYYPPAYYPPVFYNPPVVYSSPPVYVEQSPPPQAQPQEQPAQAWWYYCAAPGAYYPYVKECPGGWQRVSPTPPH